MGIGGCAYHTERLERNAWEVLMSLYDVLLVDQNATLDEIKLAFETKSIAGPS